MKTLAILFTFLIVSCTSAIPIISETDVPRAQLLWKDITLEQLRADRELYILKCSGCHGLYKPDQYSVNEWNSILPSMNVKSKLNSTESEHIKRYLSLFSKTIIN